MTSDRKILTVLALAALVALAACQKKPKEGAAPANTPPATVAPLAFAKQDADAEVQLTLPEPIKLYPALHARLYNEGQATLTAFIDQAHRDRAQNSADGIEVPPYSHSITWQISAQSPRLVSLYAVEDDYQGGAHPNNTYQALLWDKSANDLVSTGKLFTPGADFRNIDTYVCKQIEAARSKRAGTPISQTGSGFSCPKFAESLLVLIPSLSEGKIGAIDALYGPYDVGSYAEGPYEIRVPQAMLTSILAPEYAGQFGGEPVKDPVLQDYDEAPAQ